MQDNTSLAKALDAGLPVIGVVCFDPDLYSGTQFGFKKIEPFRAQFMIESVRDLQQNLAKLNVPLVIRFDTPANVLSELCETHDVQKVFYQLEWTDEELHTEEEAVRAACPNDVQWVDSTDQFLFHPDDVPYDLADIPEVFTQFRKRCEAVVDVRPTVTPKPQAPIEFATSEPPTLSELGFTNTEPDPRTAFPFKGGETEALNRLNDYFWKTKKLSVYKRTRNCLLGTDYSSKFSPWLANGMISARTIYHEVKKYESDVVTNDSTYWLVFELIWRDYFKYISLKHGRKIFMLEGIKDRRYEWSQDADRIQQWINGETREPFVNANMLELKHTGWMSNRGRQNVASYFAKDLNLDWRIGAAYFESMLVDYDVHSNYGNWMYVAGVGNDPRDRSFNVRLQAEKYDKNGAYQRRWLQESLFP